MNNPTKRGPLEGLGSEAARYFLTERLDLPEVENDPTIKEA